MQNSAYTEPLDSGTLTQLTCFTILMKFLEMIWSYKECQKVVVGRGMGRVRTKKLLAQTISDKIFGTKWSNPENWIFLRVF